MTGFIPEADEVETDPSPADTSTDTSQEEGQDTDPQKEIQLTPEQIRTIERMVREETARVASKLQSQVARGENRIQGYIQQQIAALQQTKTLLGLSDQQVQVAQDKIIRDAYTQQIDGAGQPTAQQYQQQPEMHPAIEAALAMMEAQGTIVEEGDPEFESIRPLLQAGDYRNLIATTKNAMALKTQRLQSRKGKATVRAPGGASGQPETDTDISGITDSKELYRLGSRQVHAGGRRK